MQQTAHYSRAKGLHYLAHNNPGRALAHFTVALSLVPEWRTELKGSFFNALSGGCKELQRENKLQTAIDIRKVALKLYPNNEANICDLATLHFQLGDLVKAVEFYHLSLNINPDFLPAFRALQTMRSMLLERWHFRMLNDTNRNKCYRKAIAQKIQEGHQLILDIGAGSGLLSLFAAHENAKFIYACEVQDSIFNMAVNIIEENNFKHKISLKNKISTDLKVPDDIPQKVSLVVTEIFDAALFGEGILQALIHAWDNLLLPSALASNDESITSAGSKTYGTVIPEGGNVWIAAIQCVDIARRHRLLPNRCLCKEKLCQDFHDNPISYGDYLLCKFCEAPVTLKGDSENLVNCLWDAAFACAITDEPYDVEDLESIPFGYKFLTKPYNIINVNFNCVDDLKQHLMSSVKECSLNVTEDGSVDAVVSWFQLNLDGSNKISTAPFLEDGHSRGWCWHQAIFPCVQPVTVFCGESVGLNYSTKDGVLKIDLNYEHAKQTGIDKKIDRFSSHGSTYALEKPNFTVSKSVVTFLNNRSWIYALQETAKYLFQTLCSAVPSSYQILDLNLFPVLGLELLKLCNSSEVSWKLFVCTTFPDSQYIMYVAEKYGIKQKQLEFISALNEILEVGNYKFDVINLTLTDSTGEMCNKTVDSLSDLRSRLSSTGVMVPYSVTMQGKIVESDWLQKNSMVTTDENVGGFKVSKFVNNFKLDFQLDLKIHGLPHKPLSDPVEVMTLYTNLEGSGSLCSEKTTEIVIIPHTCGLCTGFLYWMKFNLLPGMNSVSTVSHDSHCGQVAFLESLPLVDKSALLLKCSYYFGIFRTQLKRQLRS